MTAQIPTQVAFQSGPPVAAEVIPTTAVTVPPVFEPAVGVGIAIRLPTRIAVRTTPGTVPGTVPKVTREVSFTATHKWTVLLKCSETASYEEGPKEDENS